jgi:GTP-binding protein EngB required for normal cell division
LGNGALPLFPANSDAAPVDPQLQHALDLAAEIVGRYGLSSTNALLASCRSALARREITIAIVGRFKAGKSSFLNHFLHRSVLPVGVVPVTTVVTEVRFGPTERAEVRFLDGHAEQVRLSEVAGYVSERENAENHKRVATIRMELPDLARFPELIFVDTPGLESMLPHNTEASLNWLPNVGLALVAVSVDPALSRQDIELLKNLYRFTTNVSILLTKVDLLGVEERSEVLDYIRTQLTLTFGRSPEIFPYSVRPGYEELRAQLEQRVIKRTLKEFGGRRREILSRKIDTLLRECSDYLTLNRKSAELLDSEREAVKSQVIGQRDAMADVKSELHLIVRHAAGSTRATAAAVLEPHQGELERRLLTDFSSEFPAWTKSLAVLLSSFEHWLDRSLSVELAGVSLAERSRLIEPLQKTRRRVLRYLQEFRDRLSEGTVRAFGIPLHTAEVEIEIPEPRTPDIRVGRIFDRNWELLSSVLPVTLIKPLVRRHFAGKIPGLVSTNLSRLTSQWEEGIHTALLSVGKEADRRLEELIATVEGLIETARAERVPGIEHDLERIAAAREAIVAERDAS